MEGTQILQAPARLFVELGRKIGGWSAHRRDYLRPFRALFGVTPLKCTLLTNRLTTVHGGANVGKPVHLLWALLLGRTYSTEEDLAGRCDTWEKNFREKAWHLLELLSELDLIDWAKRNVGWYIWNINRTSVDGTDYCIQEQHPFDPKWYSHKFRGPAV